ncbi:ABCB27 [Symbiodinium natans]|uniref:ABCB27 protein n=1 Tax=Symbiodinium natans TaxID=878477 RepID=A0A812VFS8_9DINO|nr:ABCB27 [Symbiodinium natans]
MEKGEKGEKGGKGGKGGKGDKGEKAEKGEGKGKRRPASRGRPKAEEPGAPPRRSSSAPSRPREEPAAQKPRPRRASSTASRGRRPPRTDRPRANWGHPEGKKFDDLDVDSRVDGVVVNVGDFGVFIDIGYEQNVILAVPRRFWRRFRRGDVLEDMEVVSVDLDLRRSTVTVADVEEVLKPSRIPLEELQEGSYLNGVVDTKNQYGVFVNVGCDGCHGKLQLPRFLANQLVRGQVLRDLCVATVDLELKRVRLIMDDVEGAIADQELVSLATLMADAEKDKDPKKPKPAPLDQVEQPKPKASPKAKENRAPKAKSQKAEKAEAPDEAKDEEGPQLEPGDLVDGVVVSINSKGVWVSIGGKKKAILEVPADLKGEFRRGDTVQGMRVEEVNEDGNPVLSMDDPELEVEETNHRRTRNKPKGKAKGKSNRRA